MGLFINSGIDRELKKKEESGQIPKSGESLEDFSRGIGGAIKEGLSSVVGKISKTKENIIKFKNELIIKKNIEKATNLSELASYLESDNYQSSCKDYLDKYCNDEITIKELEEALNKIFVMDGDNLDTKFIRKTEDLIKLEELKNELHMKKPKNKK